MPNQKPKAISFKRLLIASIFFVPLAALINIIIGCITFCVMKGLDILLGLAGVETKLYLIAGLFIGPAMWLGLASLALPGIWFGIYLSLPFLLVGHLLLHAANKRQWYWYVLLSFMFVAIYYSLAEGGRAWDTKIVIIGTQAATLAYAFWMLVYKQEWPNPYRTPYRLPTKTQDDNQPT